MSDNHKNTLKTAWNDITGDTIRTGKGSQSKYADNWEGIFGKKKEESKRDIFAEIQEGLDAIARQHYGPVALEASLCVACSEPVIYLEELKHGPIHCPHCGNMFSVYHGSDELTTVLALDFHDGAK